jgi:NAD(P)-dependent dehydrogenase (short-subunit alcohol dehydrogenase family)
MARQRVALVTGASRGIGRAIVEQLLDDEFDLTVSARKPETLERAADEYRRSGRRVVSIPADFASESEVGKLAAFHLEHFEHLDVLVLCAGLGISGELGTFPLGKFDRQFTVNVRSSLQLIQLLLPALRTTAHLEAEVGTKIIAVSSITGMIAEPDLAVYGSSKAALIALCESINIAEAATGVTATSIAPGYVDTDMSEWVHDRIDPARMIRARDIAILTSALTRLSRFAAVPNIAVTRPGDQLWRA